MKVLVDKVEQSEHENPSEDENPSGPYVIDGGFLLHILPPHMPANYGGLASTIFRLVTSLAPCVHVAFDSYPDVSLKNQERSQRGQNEDSQYLITGAEQQRPRNMNECLKSRSFKEQLPKFLAIEWTKIRTPRNYKDVNCFCRTMENVTGSMRNRELCSGRTLPIFVRITKKPTP